MLVLNILSLAAIVSAWGTLGHRTVAYIAYKHVSETTQQGVDSILDFGNNNEDVSDGAIWADQVRRARPWTEGWHFIDAEDSPPNRCVVSFPSDCGKRDEGCIITAINNQTQLFLDPNTEAEVRQEALKFILHFIGDIHQPLHDENFERGWNEIHTCWHKACADMNLHSLWDTEIPEKIVGFTRKPSEAQIKDAAAQWADQLVSDSGAVDLSAECVDLNNPETCSIRWATEANAYNCKYVLTHDISWFQGRDLSTDYYNGAKPIVEFLIGKAGVRLAAWLEALFTEQNARASSQFVAQNMEF